MIRGQERLCSEIQKLSLNDFPHSVLLVGPQGSGKSLLIEFIAEHLELQTEFLNDVSFDSLTEIYLRTEPIIYVLDNMSVKIQNQILKFLEEPPRNSFIIITARRLGQYLTTIENRCRIWQLDIYSPDILNEFNTSSNSLVIEISKTPGDVINLNKSNFSEVIELANKILDKISVASYGNVFNIIETLKSDKLNIDIELFVRVLKYLIYEHIFNTPTDNKWYDIYMSTFFLLLNFTIPHIDKMQLFENYLMKLKEYYANRRS